MRIGEVSRRTGLSAATIRAWQRRYGLLSPVRSSGQQRLYSEADVAVLREVRELVKAGWALPAAADHVTHRREGASGDGFSRSMVNEAAVERTTAADPQYAASFEPDPLEPRARTQVETEVRRSTAASPERDHVALVALHDTARALLRASSGADAVAALVDLVEGLGGEAGPAAEQTDDVIPVDIGLGVTDPLLARAEPFSVARLRLEAVLPGIVEDARRMVALLRAAGR